LFVAGRVEKNVLRGSVMALMNDEKDNRSQARERDNQVPSGHAILLFFDVLAIAMSGG
jgi:hypothetical protein